MAHFLFNVAGAAADQEQAAALLRAGMWGIGAEERHRDALAPGDMVLIYLAAPRDEFTGQAVVASAAHDWTAAEAGACPGDSRGGVLLDRAEEWDRPVPMGAAVARIDPDGSNPIVQENARAGFRPAVVLITEDEYEAVRSVRAAS